MSFLRMKRDKNRNALALHTAEHQMSVGIGNINKKVYDSSIAWHNENEKRAYKRELNRQSNQYL